MSEQGERITQSESDGDYTIQKGRFATLLSTGKIAATLAAVNAIAFIAAACGDAAATPTPSPTPTAIAEPSPTPVLEPTPVPVVVPTPTPTPVPVVVPTPTLTPVPVVVPTPTPTPVPVVVPTPTPTPVPTDVSIPTLRQSYDQRVPFFLGQNRFDALNSHPELSDLIFNSLPPDQPESLGEVIIRHLSLGAYTPLLDFHDPARPSTNYDVIFVVPPGNKDYENANLLRTDFYNKMNLTFDTLLQDVISTYNSSAPAEYRRELIGQYGSTDALLLSTTLIMQSRNALLNNNSHANYVFITPEVVGSIESSLITQEINQFENDYNIELQTGVESALGFKESYIIPAKVTLEELSNDD